MKTTGRLFIGVLTFLVVAATAYAESSREQLKQMVEQLQKQPGDDALREKIIRLATTLNPAPAVSEEAERRLARGEAAFELAKGPEDYANAVREFQASAAVAPWLATPYFNLGVAEEKAGHPKQAMESFRWYLLAAPGAKDAAEIRKRLFKLEYAAEQGSQEAAVAAKEQRIIGTWRGKQWALSDGESRLLVLHVRKGTDGKWDLLSDYHQGQQVTKDMPFTGRNLTVVDGELRFEVVEQNMNKSHVCATYNVRGTVSADGGTLSLAYTLMPFASDRSSYMDCPYTSSHSSYVRTYTR